MYSMLDVWQDLLVYATMAGSCCWLYYSSLDVWQDLAVHITHHAATVGSSCCLRYSLLDVRHDIVVYATHHATRAESHYCLRYSPLEDLVVFAAHHVTMAKSRCCLCYSPWGTFCLFSSLTITVCRLSIHSLLRFLKRYANDVLTTSTVFNNRFSLIYRINLGTKHNKKTPFSSFEFNQGAYQSAIHFSTWDVQPDLATHCEMCGRISQRTVKWMAGSRCSCPRASWARVPRYLASSWWPCDVRTCRCPPCYRT